MTLQRLLTLGLTLILAACGSGGQSQPARSTDGHFLVGTGLANHDPQAEICVGGGASFCGRKVDPAAPGAIRDELLARAAAITGANGQTLILITTTNIGYFLAYKDEEGGEHGIHPIQLRIHDATGVPPENIVVVSDHSHNGPDTIGIWGGVSPDYKAITADAVVAAATSAFASREPARLQVAAINQNTDPLADIPRLDSSYNTAPAFELDAGNPSNEFRLLVADSPSDGRRLLSLINYAPHATVINGAATDQLSGDWAAWAPFEAEAMFGGFGFAAIGSVGATDWNKSGDNADEKEAEARQRLRRLLSAADEALQPVNGDNVDIATTFIREPITQPILLANYKPKSPLDMPGSPGQHFDLRIDRAVTPPFLQGTVFGTFVSAIRIGDVFISTFPGEPFGELEAALRTGVDGPQAHFLLGGANDFFGYMVLRDETYQQTFSTGATWLAGCPEQEFLYDPLGLEYDGACSDHWTLMVSPTIGQHIVCSLRNGANAIGFAASSGNERCPALTALDGLAPPSTAATPAQRDAENQRRAQDLPGLCATSAAPAEVCSALTGL